jgi:RNA 3'-terminal phosphate cyclase (ATP)
LVGGLVEIDGSYKSGSGTILRDSILLSALLGRPVYVHNIRAKREKPGLRPQHLSVVEVVKTLTGGLCQGASVGSKEVFFRPGGEIRSRDFFFDVGTAGSATMLALTIIPIGLFSKRASSFKIRGGLFQDFAPSFFHLKYVVVPLLRMMGAEIEIKMVRPGFVPKGGGEMEVKIRPLDGPLSPLMLAEPGAMRDVVGIALSSHLKERKVSERMARECKAVLRAKGYEANIEMLYDTNDSPAFEAPALQEGAALAVWANFERGAIIGSDMVGEKGRSAETIGKRVASMLIEDIESGATCDRFSSDQVILFCALARGESVFKFPFLSEHMESRIWLVEQMVGANVSVQGREIHIRGVGFKV